MTLTTTVKWMVLLGVALLVAQACTEKPLALKTPKDKVNYGLGVGVARNFKRQGIEVDADAVVKGLRDALAGDKLLMTEEELHTTMTAFQVELRKKQTEATKLASEKNKKEGEAFLAENKKKDGVVTLSSGLQYKILKAGEGKKPMADDSVVVQYRGTLLDGTEFDSSDRRKRPATLSLSRVIRGWTEALQLMPAGSKWQLFIPADLAYGEQGAPRVHIGPNAALIFEVELLSVKEKSTQSKGADIAGNTIQEETTR